MNHRNFGTGMTCDRIVFGGGSGSGVLCAENVTPRLAQYSTHAACRSAGLGTLGKTLLRILGFIRAFP